MADMDTISLLRIAATGDLQARDEAWSRVYDEVLAVARAQRRRWTGDWTMETRVLANEVFIKVFGDRPPNLKDRRHFFTLLAKAVRQILVNYSEGRRAAKRGGGRPHVSLAEAGTIAQSPEVSDRLLDLHDALEQFESLDERAARVVELRFFAGLNYEEIAETLGVSRATAVRDWEAAKAWLHREMGGARGVEPPLESMGDQGEGIP